ncbi:MAG: N-acetylmuramoyl-L-alanine amidase [Faecalibacterium sp.]|nr:N-acetylmuramoyl-L-alanine amidase [Faecalibacterium sp.]
MTQTEATPQAPRKQKKRSRVLPVLLILAALAIFGAFGLFLRAVLSGEWPEAKTTAVAAPEVVLLDDTWSAQAAACASRKELEAKLDQTLADVKALGANAVALTGCTGGGSALFQDTTKTLSPAASLEAAKAFALPFDAVQYLVRAAAGQGIQVYLLASDGRSALGADALASLPEWETRLAEKHGLTILAPQDTGSALVSVYVPQDAGAAFLRADGNPALLASALQNAADGAAAGVILGSYSTLKTDISAVTLYHAYVSGGALPSLASYQNGKTIAQTLAVTYPTPDNDEVHTAALFLMGTSDPAQPLTLNGSDITRYGTGGVWGILLSLNSGANAFDLANGSATLHYTVNYTAAAGGTVSPAADGTAGEEAIGKKIQITDAIASALQDAANSSTIGETLYCGATATITGVRTYTSGAKITHAYQLTTGEYVRAASCQIVDVPDAAVSSLDYLNDAGANCATITLPGGTPAVYHNWEDNTLTLTFLSAQCAAGTDAITNGGWLTGATVENGDGLFKLTLTFPETDPLYGWAVNYDTDANTTTIWLKHTPHLSDAATGPLTGLTVMLDPGHGGDEKGAMGSAGMEAPVEKELNLSAAQAAKYRLEQLGATVILTRGDDTTVTLGQRVTAMNEQHPDLFVSVHHNSVELTNDVNLSTGTEAYWFYDEGEVLADNLIAGVCTATGRQNRGSDYGYYYVTRSNICPATLLELGFVTNPAEYEDCASTRTLWAEGGAIADGIYQTVAANG